MELKKIGKFVENGKFTQALERALSSYFFPLVTAFVTVLCYYLGWEIVTVWFICLSGAAIMICCKDVTPVVCLIFFLNIMVSLKHCPGYLGASSDYFIRPHILAQEVIAVVLFIGSMIWRTVSGVVSGRFKTTPLFWGLVAFSAALSLGGLFYSHYTVLNFLYGLALSVVLIGIFVFIFGNTQINGKTFKLTAYYFLILFAAMAFELLIAYCTYEGLIVGGKVDRGKLFFGWGTYNNMGFLLTLTLPAWFYLSCKSKYGWAFLLGALLNVAACFLCMSRQAMLFSVIIFAACCIWLLVCERGKKRLINAGIISAIILVLFILFLVFRVDVKHFFSSIWDSLESGSGRIYLWKMGMDNFMRKPLFGVGWYDSSAPVGVPGYWAGGLSYCIPRMCHNTIFQLLSACGLVGLITYVVHCTQTVNSLINNPSNERVFLEISILTVALVCLLDNHIFYFLPTMIYAVLIALLAASEGNGRKSVKL